MERSERGHTGSLVPPPSDSPQTEAAEVKGRPYNDWRGKALTLGECNKVNNILAACEDPKDWDILASLATSTGGFLDDEVRQGACTLTIYHSLRMLY